METGSSLGTLGDLLGESRRPGDIKEHYSANGGLFDVLPHINLDTSVSIFETDGRLPISTIVEVLHLGQQHKRSDWCHFSVRIKSPSEALEYIRKKFHKLVGPTKFLQIVLHEENNVNPHFHFVHAGTTPKFFFCVLQFGMCFAVGESN